MHVLARDARREPGIDLRQRHDGMPPRLHGQPIDEVHDTVLESPDVEPVDDVHDQRRRHRIPVHCARDPASARSIDGDIADANSRSVACAASPGARMGVYMTTRAESSPRPESFDQTRRAFATYLLSVVRPSTQYSRNTSSRAALPTISARSTGMLRLTHSTPSEPVATCFQFQSSGATS